MTQFGSGKCSICGSLGTSKLTCPLNPDAKNPNPSKHPLAKKSKIYLEGFNNTSSFNDYSIIVDKPENAEFIITTSAYSLNFIKSIFPKVKNKIFETLLRLKG